MAPPQCQPVPWVRFKFYLNFGVGHSNTWGSRKTRCNMLDFSKHIALNITLPSPWPSHRLQLFRRACHIDPMEFHLLQLNLGRSPPRKKYSGNKIARHFYMLINSIIQSLFTALSIDWDFSNDVSSWAMGGMNGALTLRTEHHGRGGPRVAKLHRLSTSHIGRVETAVVLQHLRWGPTFHLSILYHSVF